MAKRDSEFEGFLRGLETARRTALEAEKDGGRASDMLERVIRMRRSTGVTIACTPKELAIASETMKAYTIQSVLAMTLIILYEQNGWGTKRLKRFMDEFNLHTAALMDGSIEWQDIVDCLSAEVGVELSFPKELMQQKISNS